MKYIAFFKCPACKAHQDILNGTKLGVEIDHNVKSGVLDHCQICGARNLDLVLDCGHQPLCDSLVPQSRLSEPEQYFPLRQFRCPNCTNNQLDYIVDGSTVYHPEYPYRTGVTKELS